MRYAFRKKRYQALASALDVVGGLASAARRVKPFPVSPKKILVVRLDQLGDLLPATALPQVLKENFGGAQVYFLTNPSGEALLRHNPYVDRVWVFEPGWYSRGKRNTPGALKEGKLVRELRNEKIDLAFSLRGDARENLLLRRAGVGFSVGYGITGGGFLLDRTAPYAEAAHESQHVLNLLAFAGIRPSPLKPKVYFSEEEERLFKEDLRRAGIEGKGWTGVQADAGTEAKEWPLDNLERFLSLCEKERPNAKLVFIGSDAGRGEWLERRLAESKSPNRRSLVGKTGLRQLLFLLRSLDRFIGADSGPAHAAASFGVPTLFLASGTNVFEKWKPPFENAEFLRHEVPCAPCHRIRCNVNGHPCMRDISPEAVLGWLKERAHA